ncbi:tRNA dihydrouridine synthase DusB [Candidatus Uhrbacteria bacterium]|nr:tRNA dihydrouridine synthase DusB [Candidatus Uhrbacteria bacterium]
MKLDWSKILNPIIALSPMADMTDQSFCRVVKDLSKQGAIMNGFGSPIVFREMVSAEAVVRGNEKTLGMTDIHPDERPIVQQLFGSDPDTLAEAARIIEEQHHPEGFDLNMGCPVYKIVHNFNGAALMKEPALATKIIQKIKSVISVPLSIKIRTGWSDPKECLEFSKVIEAAGADLITVHGRTKLQGYSGESDWNVLREVKHSVSIPVLANGDIHTAPLTFEALKTTQCDGVLIARGALGNPWIFSQIEDLLAGKQPQPITLEERVRVIKQHLVYHTEQYGERGIPTFRKHLSWYLRGIPKAKIYKEQLHTAQTQETVFFILDHLVSDGLIEQELSERDANHPQAAKRVFMKK